MKSKGYRRKTRWFFRLKTQFIVAIAVSVFIAFVVTSIIATISSTLLESYFDQHSEYDEVKLEKAYGEMAVLIKDKGLKPEDYPKLEAIFDRYKEFDFVVSIAEKGMDNNQMLIDSIVYSDYDNAIESAYYENDFALYIITANNNEVIMALIMVVLGVLVLFIIIFVSCISFFVGRKQKYLSEIDNGLELLAGGDLNHRIRITGHDEITSVVKNINHMSETLKGKIDQEKAIEATKNELIANISHDLRTPLTSITGFLTLLKGIDDKNSLNAIEYIDVALNKSTEMAKLIEQLFDYVMLANNQMTLNFERVEMSLVMAQSSFECKSLFEEDGFIVHTFIDEMPSYVKVDTGRFMRVMNNLVQNIRKYANKSMVIEIKAYREKNFYKIHLVNGLKEGADIDRDVFTRYFTSNRADQKSVGLGLAICREIIHHHGGLIEAESENQWFEIIITLPIAE